jgi:GMP synthase-like glutamine amidotransferase
MIREGADPRPRICKLSRVILKKALVIQHMEHDHVGRFAEYFAEDGIIPTTVRPFKGEAMPDLTGFDLMFVLGGAQNTWEEAEHAYLRDEKQAIRTWVTDMRRPYLGICLGHQLLADALGGQVGLAAAPEVGVLDVEIIEGKSVLAGLPLRMKVMQWHHAEVQVAPEGAKVLARSATTAVQALQVGQHAFSTQFHCEFTPQAVLGWAALPSYVAALEKELGDGAHGRMVEQCWPHMPGMARHTRMLWENFKRVSGL